MKDKIPLDVVLEVLNDAFKRDPVAMWAIMHNRVPCNGQLANYPAIPVESQNGGSVVGAMGILNGVVFRLTGQMVAAQVSEDEPGQTPRLLGFTRYTGPLPKKATESGLQPGVKT